MTVLVALLLIGSMMFLLLKNKVSPVVAFALLPIGAALLLGTPIGDIVKWADEGVLTTSKNAILFIFSIIYFGVMSDAGMFDPIVDFLVKKAGKSPVLVFIATALVALVSQLDGATATTYLITIPAFLPIYKRIKLSPLAMLTTIGVTTGVFNMVPWGGTVIRTANTLNKMQEGLTSAQDLWLQIIPLQVIGLGLALGLAVYFGISEKKRLIKEYGSNYFDTLGDDAHEHTTDALTNDKDGLKRPKLLIINLLVTVVLIFILIKTKTPQYMVFLWGSAAALLINYRGLKEQSARIAAHAPNALATAGTFLAAGVFLGIFKEAGMTKALADVIVNAMPEALLPQLHRIVALFGAPIGIFISPDLYYYSLLPVIAEVSQSLAVPLQKVGMAMLIGENVGLVVSPVIPTTFLAIGLAGVELKDHIKFSLKYVWGASVILMVCAFFMGLI